MNGRFWWRGTWLATIGAAVALVGVFAPLDSLFPALRSLELLRYDRAVASLPTIPPDPRVVLVALGDETPAAIPELAERPFYPLPRELHARLTDALRKAGARTIGFDLMFAQPTLGDPAFEAAISRHGNVVTGLIPKVSLSDGIERASFENPVLKGVRVGSLLVPKPFGNTVRWIEPYRADDEKPGVRQPHFALALVAAYHDEADSAPLVRDTLAWGAKLQAPLLALGDDARVLPIRWLGVGAGVPEVSYQSVLDGSWRKSHPPDFFRDRIALVGRISATEDLHMTPVGEIPGPQIHAQLVSSLLSGRYIRWADGRLWGALAVGLFLLAVGRLTLLPGLGVGLLLAGVGLGAAQLVFARSQLYIEALPALAQLAGAMVLATIYEGLRTRRALARLLPSWAVRGAASGRLALGTQARPVSVAFCDIRGFTTFCETHAAEEVEALLRAYFAAGDSAARALGTELDKYMGDAMMLYFLERKGREPHPTRAVRWAQEMQRASEKLGVGVGVGIATGVAHEGLVGVPRRMQPTVIGDVVNLASRLQDQCKTLDSTIVLDGATAEIAGKTIEIEPLGEVFVRGKQEAVAVFAPKERA